MSRVMGVVLAGAVLLALALVPLADRAEALERGAGGAAAKVAKPRPQAARAPARAASGPAARPVASARPSQAQGARPAAARPAAQGARAGRGPDNVVISGNRVTSGRGNNVVAVPRGGWDNDDDDWDLGQTLLTGAVAGGTAALVQNALTPSATSQPVAAAPVAAAPATAAPPVAPAPAPQPVAPAPEVGSASPGGSYAFGTRFTQPLPNCEPVQQGSATYQRCGADWLQPFLQGGNVVYVVVPPPA